MYRGSAIPARRTGNRCRCGYPLSEHRGGDAGDRRQDERLPGQEARGAVVAQWAGPVRVAAVQAPDAVAAGSAEVVAEAAAPTVRVAGASAELAPGVAAAVSDAAVRARAAVARAVASPPAAAVRVRAAPRPVRVRRRAPIARRDRVKSTGRRSLQKKSPSSVRAGAAPSCPAATALAPRSARHARQAPRQGPALPLSRVLRNPASPLAYGAVDEPLVTSEIDLKPAAFNSPITAATRP